MAGILSVFNDIAPEGYDHFERWYNHEHLQERVGGPGFRFGRRYELVSGGDRRFMAFYEVDSPDVLSSPAYVKQLESPTAWTRESMKYFRRMVRTVCDLRVAAGDHIGAYAVVLRADEKMAPGPDAGAVVEQLASDPSIARAQLWTAAARQTPSDTAEMKARGKDDYIVGALVVECVRRADADRVAAALAKPPAGLGISGKTALGVYALLCAYQPRSR
jgi:hypothetical protein